MSDEIERLASEVRNAASSLLVRGLPYSAKKCDEAAAALRSLDRRVEEWRAILDDAVPILEVLSEERGDDDVVADLLNRVRSALQPQPQEAGDER